MRGACLCVKLKSVLEYRCVLSQSLSAYCHHSPCLLPTWPQTIGRMCPNADAEAAWCFAMSIVPACIQCIAFGVDIFNIIFISYFSYYPLSFGSLDLCVPTHRMCTLAWYSVYFLVVCRVCFLVYVWAVDVQSVKEIPM